MKLHVSRMHQQGCVLCIVAEVATVSAIPLYVALMEIIALNCTVEHTYTQVLRTNKPIVAKRARISSPRPDAMSSDDCMCPALEGSVRTCKVHVGLL